jgi:hypothetical protein
MLESVTYQMIIEEGIEKGREQGEVHGALQMLLDMGTDRFGTPDSVVVAALERVTSLSELRRLGPMVRVASSWDELLASV